MSLLTRIYVLTRLHARHRFALLGVVGMLMAVTPWLGPLREHARELQALLDVHAVLDPVGQAVMLQRGLLAHQPAARRVLRGESAVEPERAVHARAVDDRIAALAEVLHAGHPGPALEESQALQTDWHALVEAIGTRSIGADGSDAAHRLLIEQTLQLIDLVAAAPATDGAPTTQIAGLALGSRHLLPALEAALARAASDPAGKDEAGRSLDLAEARTIWHLIERQHWGRAGGHAAVDRGVSSGTTPPRASSAKAIGEATAAVEVARAEVARAEAARGLAQLLAAPGPKPLPAPEAAQAAAAVRQHVAQWHDAERDALAAALAADMARLQARLRDTVVAAVVHAMLWMVLLALLARWHPSPPSAPATPPVGPAGEPVRESLPLPNPAAAARGTGGEHRASARSLLERLRRPGATRESAPPSR
jgi:hypothetical protein